MTTTARMPRSAAASATPCAWFPAEEQTTPRARSSRDNRASFTSGPRSLYDPVRWNSSALSRTSKPVCSDSSREVRSGVRRAWRATNSCAARESGRAKTLTHEASHVASLGGSAPVRIYQRGASARGRAHDHGHALDGVVAEAVEVPLRVERLRPSGRIRGAARKHVLARLGVPPEAPARPGEAGRARLDRRVGPALAAVGADLDALDRPPPRPRPTLELTASRLDQSPPREKDGDA